MEFEITRKHIVKVNESDTRRCDPDCKGYLYTDDNSDTCLFYDNAEIEREGDEFTGFRCEACLREQQGKKYEPIRIFPPNRPDLPDGIPVTNRIDYFNGVEVGKVEGRREISEEIKARLRKKADDLQTVMDICRSVGRSKMREEDFRSFVHTRPEPRSAPPTSRSRRK